MDFFEAQARAKKRTSRLVLLFAFAVGGTVAAGYFAALLFLQSAAAGWWDPPLFIGVVLGTFAVVGLASLYKWQQFSSGGAAVAESVGGRAVDPQTRDLKERRLLNVVEEMAIASGIPVPSAYVLDNESAINAFAAGLTPNDAVVAVTRGALDKLARDELQGVVGHEFSHILNGDMRLNLRIGALVFGILVLGLGGRAILWSLRGTRSRGKNGGGAIMAIMLIGLALLVIGYVGYFFGRLIQAAVSREREFLADASAVQFTRNPVGLAGALRKIGGYALGSSLQASQSAALGHFFFAQAFRAGITGWWSTHPPLTERIRAIDPGFDGKFFEPPQVVDVARESFVDAGLAPARPAASGGGRGPGRDPIFPLPAGAALAAVAASGAVTSDQLENAQTLLADLPARLAAAARTHEAEILVYALLLADEPAVRARQWELLSNHGEPEKTRVLRELEGSLPELKPTQKLPLLQLALPSIRRLAPAALASFLELLDELVHADERVSPFEFALQKLLIRALDLGRNPGAIRTNIYSFNAVTAEISLVLSVLARAAVIDGAAAPEAFAVGASQIKLIAAQLRYIEESQATLAALDTALDRLAEASGPIKQRTLVAAAHIAGADGEVRVPEAELLRAIAAALDVPLPPLSGIA